MGWPVILHTRRLQTCAGVALLTLLPVSTLLLGSWLAQQDGGNPFEYCDLGMLTLTLGIDDTSKHAIIIDDRGLHRGGKQALTKMEEHCVQNLLEYSEHLSESRRRLGSGKSGLNHDTSDCNKNCPYNMLVQGWKLSKAAYFIDSSDVGNNISQAISRLDSALINCGPEATQYTTLVPFIASDDSRAFLVVYDFDVYLVFKGTTPTSAYNDISDTDAFRTSVKSTEGMCTGNVHNGFYESWGRLRNAIEQDRTLSSLASQGSYRLHITGHSLGAALATIATCYVITNYEDSFSRVSLQTYGSPRVFDSTAAHAFQSNVIQSLYGGYYRVTHKKDLVPTVPPFHLMGFNHVGEEWWFDDDGSKSPTDTCLWSLESSSNLYPCYRGRFVFSVDNHLDYFGMENPCGFP